MSVYIEFVLLDNLIINFIILYLSRRKAKWYFLLLSSILGTAVSVLYPFYMNFPALAVLVIKLACSLVLPAIICGRGVKSYLKTLGLFYIYTFMLGGICFGILYLLGDVDFFAGGLMYSVKVPIGILIGGVFLLGFFGFFLSSYIRHKKYLFNVQCEVEISVRNKIVRVKGMIDTGNTLRDSETGNRVIIVDKSVLYDIISDEKGLLSLQTLKKGHYIECNTISSANNRIFLFQPDKLLFYYRDSVHRIENIMIGFSAVENVLSSEVRALVPYFE